MGESKSWVLTTGIGYTGFVTAVLLVALGWNALRVGNFSEGRNTNAQPGNDTVFAGRDSRPTSVPLPVASSVPRQNTGRVEIAGGQQDLCTIMSDAGAELFGRGQLQVFEPLRGNTSAAAAVRQRRCSFRTYGVSRNRYQDLQVVTSTQPESASHFYSAMGLAQSDTAAQYATEGGIGVAGYSWARNFSHEAGLHYLLPDGRQLTVRWTGAGTDPQADISSLRDFARRVAERME